MKKHEKIYTDNCFKLKEKLFELLKNENIEQLHKWGIQKHTIFEWLAYTTEELGELSNAISEYHYRNGLKEDIVKEAIQTATLSLKIAEMLIIEIIAEFKERNS